MCDVETNNVTTPSTSPSPPAVDEGEEERKEETDDTMPNMCDLEEIEGIVLRTTEVFSKPAPDKARFAQAVTAVVVGELTIKEASTKYQFATSTLHPYVHKARHVMGDRAPPLKNPPRIVKATGESLISKISLTGTTGASSSPRLTTSYGRGSLVSGLSLLHHGAEDLHATYEDETEESQESVLVADSSGIAIDDEMGLDLGEMASGSALLGGDELIDHLLPAEDEGLTGEHRITYTVEEAVQEAIDTLNMSEEVDTSQLFLAVVRCVNSEVSIDEASADYGISRDLLDMHVVETNQLLGVEGEEETGTLSDKEVERSCREAIQVSSYTGEAKERLFRAVFETVIGNLPSTQAAHTHSIPFSTLHPYVKKARIALGLLEETTIIDSNGRKRVIPLADGVTPSKKKLRVANQSSTSASGVNMITPFKPMKIPDSWRNNPKVLRQAVLDAVNNCKYGNDHKKSQLAQAVLEAVGGKQTMKAAALMYDVPFTTLQTYFHRARVVIVRMLGDDPCPRRDGSTTEAGPESGSDSPFVDDAGGEILPSSFGSLMGHKKASALDFLSHKLQMKQEEMLDSNSNSSGGSKRKPPTFMMPSGQDDSKAALDAVFSQGWEDCVTVEPQSPDDHRAVFPRANALFGASKYNSPSSNNMSATELAPRVPDDWFVQDGKMRFNVERAVEKATKNSHFTGKQREDMMDALVESVKGLVTLKDAARSRNINVGTLQTYYHRARSMVEAVRGGSKPSHVMEMSASQASAAARKIKDDELGLFDGLDRNELSQEALCEEAVNRVIRSSLYPPEQKDRLRNSVNKVISGAMTINAAANLYGLPSSTVHPYVHRVRAALGDDCPPQAVGPTPHIYNFNGQKTRTSDVDSRMSSSFMSAKDTLRGARTSSTMGGQPKQPIDLEKADAIVSELVKSSLYGESGRKKLYEAVLLVVTESASCSEAARTYSIPPSTIQPYVQKARVALQDPNSVVPKGPNGGVTRRIAAPPVVDARNGVAQSRFSYNGGGSSSRIDARATDEEIEEAVERSLKHADDNGNAELGAMSGDRRDILTSAVVSAVAGRMSIRDACAEYDFNATTIHPHVAKARQLLGSRCPPPNVVHGAEDPIVMNGDDEMSVHSDGSNGVRPPDDPVPALDNCLERDIFNILARYNIRGDRSKLVQAIAQVIGDNRTLAEVSGSTAIAQTTLSTYVRIAKLFLTDDTLDEYEREKTGDAKPTTASKPASTVDTHKLGGASVRATIAAISKGTAYGGTSSSSLGRPTIAAVAPPPLDVMQSLFNAVRADEGDAYERDEMRMMACVKYVVAAQYRRTEAAQQALIDALEDVLVNGLSSSESCAMHTGLSEHVVNVYVTRVQRGCAHLDAPLVDLLHKCTAELTKGRGTTTMLHAKETRNAKPSPTPSNSDALGSPVRTSRRLQARTGSEAGDEPQTTTTQLPDAVETFIYEFVHELEGLNFPLTDKFGASLGGTIAGEGDEEGLGGHADWWKMFHRKFQLKN